MIEAENLPLVPQRPTSVNRDLVQRCIEGDQDAWKQLVRSYERLIYTIAFRICHDSDVGSDILQQVCLELYQRLDEVRNVSSLPSWIATVTRRKSYDHLRALRPAEPLDEEGPIDSADVFGNIERQHELERAMASLPERSRRLIEMLYMSGGGHSYEEIAAKLGIPVSSIGPTRIRLLKKLRKLLA